MSVRSHISKASHKDFMKSSVRANYYGGGSVLV